MLARFKLPSALLGGEDDDLDVPAQEDADEGVTPSERFYGMKPDARTNIRSC